MQGELIIAAVGDISTGDHPVCVGHGMRHIFATQKQSVLESVAPYLRGDITIGNLEAVTSNVGLRRYWLPSYEMRGDPASLSYLKAAGIDLVSIANNHAMQHGEASFFDMLQQIEGAGLNYIGLDNGQGLTIPFKLDVNGGQHTFFAISQRPEERYKSRVPYSLRLNVDALIEEVMDLRKTCPGFLICSVHWGLEFLKRPGPDQVSTGRRLIDAGVDVIFGHHSHILQPVERYKNGLIFYSLGNFTFDLWLKDTKLSAVAKVRLRADQSPDYCLVPVVIGDSFCLEPASETAAKSIREFSSELSSEAFEQILSQPYDRYREEYENARRAVKPLMYRYFFDHAWGYPPHFFVQSIGRTVLRRLSGR